MPRGVAGSLGPALLPSVQVGQQLKRKHACMRAGEGWLVGEGE